MTEGYRQFLYRWIYDRNQSWLQKDIEPFINKYNHRESIFVKEVRDIEPLKRESYVIRSNEKVIGGQIHISLYLRNRNMYRFGGQTIEESIDEGITFYLQLENHGWEISNVDIENIVNSNASSSIITVKSDKFQFFTKSGYDREKAVAYAEAYWNTYNPKFRYFKENDCTSFISQCLYTGGIPMTKGWYYYGPNNYSYSWAVAHSLYWYLRKKRTKGLLTEMVSTANQLKLGDVICYDWEGDGKWNHNTIVTMFDANGEPLVNAHTTNSQHRYWEYTDSTEYRPGKTKYAFFHILD